MILNDLNGNNLLGRSKPRNALTPCIKRMQVQPTPRAKLLAPKPTLIELTNQMLCFHPAQPALRCNQSVRVHPYTSAQRLTTRKYGVARMDTIQPRNSLIFSYSSSRSRKLSAGAVSSTCFALRPPTIAAVIAGLCSVHATATTPGFTPWAEPISRSRSTRRRLRLSRGSLNSVFPRRQSSAGSRRRARRSFCRSEGPRAWVSN